MKLNRIYSFLVSGILVACASCSPEEVKMPAQGVIADDLVEGISFSITHDAENPNIIHLTSLMPTHYAVAWEHPQGRATTASCDLKIPFAGEYQVKFGVSTPGGYVWGNPVTFTVDDMCAEFISDPLWTMLTGGGGSSKTWVIDVNENGEVFSPFRGPKWFFTAGYTWDGLHNAKGQSFMDEDWDASTAIDPSWNGVWYWAADYPGNGWMCSAKDYGTYTFDLIGGANLTIVKDGQETKGKFNMDAERHTFSLSGVEFEFFPGLKDYNILYMDENLMMLLCNNPAEAETWTSINFMSKDYLDRWEPTPEVKTLPEGWYETFRSQNRYASWALSMEDPFDFFTLDGNRKNQAGNFSLAGDFTAVALDFDNPALGLYAAADIDGNTFDGNYTVTENGLITLDGGIGSSALASPGITLSCSPQNTLKVVDVAFDDLGRLSDIWMGYDLTDFNGKPYQTVAFHYVAVFGGDNGPTYQVKLQLFDTSWAWFDAPTLYIKGEGTYTMESQPGYVDPYGIFLDIYKVLGEYPNFDCKLLDIKVNGESIEFDDAAISRGVGDDPVIARRYILNPWGDASMTPMFATTADGTVSVTFQIVFDNGTPFIPEE